MLLDAYVYGSFDFEGTNLQLRLGNQVVNWGESIFIQGVNQINPIDVPAARRPGTELKEILLPVWMAYANWGFDWGSIEAFYQLEWQNTSIDACGTYWAVTENNISVNPGQCNSATVITSVHRRRGVRHVVAVLPATRLQPVRAGQRPLRPAGRGQGSARQRPGRYRHPFPGRERSTPKSASTPSASIHRLPYISGLAGSLPTELPGGAWILAPGTLSPLQTSPYPVAFMNAGLPVWRVPGSGANPLDPNDDTVLRGPSAAHAALAAKLGVPVTPGRSFWEYPEDMQIFGFSAATNLFSWSVSAEASIQKDVPAQVNGNDLLNGLLSFVGPNAAEGLAAALQGAGGYAKGYDLFDKQQFQVNARQDVQQRPVGAENMLVVAEVGAQTNNVPDYTKGARALRPRLRLRLRLEPADSRRTRRPVG